MGEPGASSNEPSTSTASSSGAGASGVPDDIDMSDPAIAGMTADELKKFVETGRTGRRNALPDVSQPDVSVSAASDALGAMSVKDEPGPSSASKGS